MWGYGLDRAGSGQGQVAGTCECGNEALGSIKCGEFLDQLKTDMYVPGFTSHYQKVQVTGIKDGIKFLFNPLALEMDIYT